MKSSLPARAMWTAYLAWHWRGQARFPFRSPSEIRAARARRVRRMIAHAAKTVPYYRETLRRLNLRPGDIRDAGDLALLPVIERQDLQRDPDYFRSEAVPLDSCLETRSGGSTGAPRVVWWDTGAVFQNAAHAERERAIIASMTGRFTGYRETVIGSTLSSDRDIQAIYRDRAILPRRTRVKYQHLSITDPPARNVALLNEFRPDVIRTYGSYLGRLFSFVHSSGAMFHPPKVVFYDADELPQRSRAMISGEFGIPVMSAYQAVEAFKIGFECDRHAGFHLNDDVYPVRIVDAKGIEVPPGETGEVMVSNLVNRGTVLLNYRLGDVAHLIPEPCGCGRSLPLLSFIEGRTDDWITLADGGQVHPQIIRTIFTSEQDVSQYQVVQENHDRFRVTIACWHDRDDVSSRVREKFAERFGIAAKVEIRFADFIQPSAGGKVRPVISLVRSEPA